MKSILSYPSYLLVLVLLAFHTQIVQSQMKVQIQRPSTTTTSSSSSSHDPKQKIMARQAAEPTSSPVMPVFVPNQDVNQDPNPIVQYWGPGNGGSTVYQVAETDSSGNSATFTLIEGATSIQLLGGQRAIVTKQSEPHQVVTSKVYAGVDCQFAHGYDHQGYCKHYQVVDGVTLVYSQAPTNVQNLIMVTPTATPIFSTDEPAIASSILATITNSPSVHDTVRNRHRVQSNSSSSFSPSSTLLFSLFTLGFTLFVV